MSADGGAGFMQWRELPDTSEAESSTGFDLAWARTHAVTMDRSVHRDILAHVESDLSRECAGLLFGRRANSSEASCGTLVTAARPAIAARASLTHFIMHPETWPAVWREFALEDEIDFVGWYHSHPGHGAFLSATDRTTQALWFRRTWHVAFVVDPKRREEAVFCGPRGVRAQLLVGAT